MKNKDKMFVVLLFDNNLQNKSNFYDTNVFEPKIIYAIILSRGNNYEYNSKSNSNSIR